jgi:hypothetical protein
MKPTLTLLPLTAAELRLISVLADHMVLQRDKPVAVWGWADASLRQSLGTLDSVKRRRTHSHSRALMIEKAAARARTITA